MTPDNDCFNFIKNKEGLRLTAYKDSAGIWTIGYGAIIYEDYTPVKKGDKITNQRADQLIEKRNFFQICKSKRRSGQHVN